MTHQKFRELLGKADQIGMIITIVQIGRGNYYKKVLDPENGQIVIVKKKTHYKRKYQVVINGENIGKPYARRISAKMLILKTYEQKLTEMLQTDPNFQTHTN